MTVQINYKNSGFKNMTSNLVLFVGENFNIIGLKKYISNSEFSYISDLLKTSDLKKNLLFFKINSKKTIFLVSIKKELKISDVENLGAKFHGFIDYKKKNDYSIIVDTLNSKIKNFVGYFVHGLKLKSYEFNIYKSKKDKKFVSINVIGNKNKISPQTQLRFKAIEEGTFFARDLVSEPGNILHPDEYAKRLSLLKKIGLKVNIYDEKKILNIDRIKNGNLILAIPSSGIHSNGYSLIRHILKKKKINIKKNIFLRNELIKPTKIYVDEILKLVDHNLLNGCANITGGGLADNIKRIIPNKLCASIDLGKIKTLKIFNWLKQNGISDNEMLKTFNCGVGFCLIIDSKDLKKINKFFSMDFKPYTIGKIIYGKKKIKLDGKINWY